MARYLTVMAALNIEGLRSGTLYDVPDDDPRLERWLADGIVVLDSVHDDDE